MAKKKMNLAQPTFPGMTTQTKLSEESYSGDQPNPHLRRFVERHGLAYDQERDTYNVRAFNQTITTTKATAIYNMHSYHQGKKPHDAIRQYIRHYTNSGDVVLDPFSGSGGTALAAVMEGRKAIAIDRSPAAAFITKNYCTPVDPVAVQSSFEALLRQVQPELDRLYETRCDRCGGKATTDFTVYSQVFQCSRCLQKAPLFDCAQAEGTTLAGKPKKITVCPYCQKKGSQEEISTRSERFGSVPVLVSYICQGGCSPAVAERRHNDVDPKKRQFFEKYDLEKVKELEPKKVPFWCPPHRMMNVQDDSTPWGAKWRAGTSNFRTVASLFTKRNLWALAAIRDAATKSQFPDAALFGLTAVSLALSKMQRYSPDSGFPNMLLVGTYYLPQTGKEIAVGPWYHGKLNSLIKGYRAIREELPSSPVFAVSTADARSLDAPSNSVDYIFTDPPYSDNVQYGELNFVWEAWLDFDTHWHNDEIIVNDVRGKTEADWAAMMKRAMAECYRVLKPGRWLSLCYHDTSEGTWALVQDIMAEVGFMVDKTASALFIDTGQKSFNQLTADKTTKRDLVLNFRKPKPGEWLVTQVFIPANVDIPTFQELARQIIRDVLTAHPGATKDRIYDALVSSMVRKGQMEAHDFDALLRSIAEEVQQPVKKDLFRNADPDLFGSHVQSRWYLKETADQVDRAEQAKEDAAAARLDKFVLQYLRQHPEHEGVHYSDLFEQFLPVNDKPRRLLADWLPEYFVKTPGAAWRSPDDAERRELAKLREAGTLRRIKRFANALLDGVPVREKDRPGSDQDLLDWLRQCRRAGLYDQGRALFEKGGLNLDALSPEEQIEADDTYRICARRGSTEEAKPKRQKRKTKQDQEEDEP